uniref:Uncharacterized protein n=1 Tax=Oryza brachyantha TaxID=4533 RepID=J3MGV8_ORYBR
MNMVHRRHSEFLQVLTFFELGNYKETVVSEGLAVSDETIVSCRIDNDELIGNQRIVKSVLCNFLNY